MITGFPRFLAVLIITCFTLVVTAQEMPRIDGSWWSVAGNPDLGDCTTDRQEPVDFGIWQAADGTWQLWSCIRHTACGKNTRLFYRWEGRSLTDPDWRPMGIAMQADTTLGEQSGGLQAPYVFEENGVYYMFYGGWDRICLATSTDGKYFRRWKNEDGEPILFRGPYINSRDPMVLREHGLYYCYYMGHTNQEGYIPVDGQQVRQPYKSAIFCRTSADMEHWSEPILVSAGGRAARQSNWHGGDAECPFILKKDGYYYLFRNQLYGENNLNTLYASRNPLDFGVGHDDFRLDTLPVAAPEIILHEGQYYIAALKPGLNGIRIAKLNWLPGN